MKRPLMLVGFSVALAQGAAVFLDWQNAYLLSGALAFLGAAALLARKTRERAIIPLACLCAAVSSFVTGLYLQTVVEPPRRLDGMQAVITAKVVSLPEKTGGREIYELETFTIAVEGEDSPGQAIPQRQRLRFSTATPLDVSLYDVISAEVFLTAPAANPGYSQKLSYQSEGIYLFAFLRGNRVELLGQAPRDVWYYLLQARAKLLFQLGTLLPTEQSSLLAGLTLGEKSGISNQVTDDFRLCGISHLLAVSGLHTAFLAQMLQALLCRLRVPKRLANIFAAAGILVFAALAGFTPSVTRAGVMTILFLLGGVVFRRPDSLNSLGLAALIICCVKPCAAGSLSFQLSFLATLGIVLLAGPITDRANRLFGGRLYTRIGSLSAFSFSASFASLVFTAPVLFLAYGGLSPLSFVANFFTVLPAQAAMILGMLSTLLSLWPPLLFLARPLALAAGILVNYLISAARFLTTVCVSIPIPHGLAPLWVCAALLITGFAVFAGKQKRQLVVAGLLSLVLLFAGLLAGGIARDKTVQIGIVDCGEGIAVALVQERGGILLTSGGSGSTAYRCRSYLSGAGSKRLDLLIAPAADRQSVRTAASLIQTEEPGMAWLNAAALGDELQAALQDSCQTLWEEGGGTLRVGDRITIRKYLSGSGAWYDYRIGDISLLAAVGDCDAADLPLSSRAPDLLVVSRLPRQAELLASNVAFLSVLQEQEGYLAAQLAGRADYVYSTGRNGTIWVETTGNRDLVFHERG